MWLDNESQKSVDYFWQRCGVQEGFPRSLYRSVALALPVTVIKLPHLGLDHIESWLAMRGVPFTFNCKSRDLHGCLIAFKGQGLVFMDGTDPECEQRLTLAHEIAHFLLDYVEKRNAAIAKFGPPFAEVFDGLQAPQITQRVHAFLTNVRIGVYTNLMERNEHEPGFNSLVCDIEDRADKVALALLAPPEQVLSEADISPQSFRERHQRMSALLRTGFGLPAVAADLYGRSLLTGIGRGPSWSEALRY